MKPINRSKHSPFGSVACDAALARHVELYAEYGRLNRSWIYTVAVNGTKILVEVINRRCSYVATALTDVRRLHNLPGQAFQIEPYEGPAGIG